MSGTRMAAKEVRRAMAKGKKSQLDNLVTTNRIAQNYANEFMRLAARLDELDRDAFKNIVRGQAPPMAIFKLLADAAKNLSYALEVLEGEPLRIVSGPASGLCGAIQRVAQTLGGIHPSAGPSGQPPG